MHWVVTVFAFALYLQAGVIERDGVETKGIAGKCGLNGGAPLWKSPLHAPAMGSIVIAPMPFYIFASLI